MSRCESPNFNDRPASTEISLLVIHNISLPPGEFDTGCVQKFFCNQLDISEHDYFQSIAGLEVSSHCFIQRDGSITQFVSFSDRAWHAGVSEFEGRANCNDYSIGIEMEGTDLLPYTQPQYDSLITLSRVLMQAFPLVSVDRIVGHADIAPGRKTDPGPAFDWAKYKQGLS